MRKIKILVACEESQVVTKAFRARGFRAFSCDLLPCSGGAKQWHIQRDVWEVLYDNWDAAICFPTCTHLASSGARWFAAKRADGRQQQGVDFFMRFTRLDHIKYVSIENPVGIMSSIWRKPDQIIQPWQHGHGETKATCLWLKGLPLLTPTKIVTGRVNKVWRMPPSPDRAKMRSKTYCGIAVAMAYQWGNFLREQIV